MRFTISPILVFSLPLVLAETFPAPSCPVTNVTTLLDPVTQAYTDAVSRRPSPFTFPLPEIRDGYQNNVSNPSVEITTKILSLPVGPTGNVTAYLYKPKPNDREKEDLLPVVAYFHGGAWIFGGPKSYERLITDLVLESGAAVFFVDYTLSPEAVYPVAIEQCYAAVQWLIEHGEEFGVDPAKMGFGGDSAGGEISAAVSLLSIKLKTPLPKYQVLIYPVTDISCEGTRFRELTRDPSVTPTRNGFAVSLYAPDVNSRSEDLASPALASDEDLAQFPETLIIVAEVDHLRQEGEDFGRRLQKLGVRAATLRVLGTIHGFVSINVLAQTPAARVTIELVGHQLRKALC